MWSRFESFSEQPPLKDPLLLICLSTSDPQYKLLYSQAKELGRFLLRKLEFKQISSLYSSALPPEIKVGEDGVADIVSNGFYLYHGLVRDYLLLAGYSNPVDDQFEYGDLILSYVAKLGVKELVSFGARWTESISPPLEAPKLTAFANDEEGAKKLNEIGVPMLKNESAFYFSNLIVPVSKFHGIRAYKISVDHGEPSPHPRSVMAFLSVLAKMFGLSVDAADLLEQSQTLAEEIKHSNITQEGELGESTNPQKDDIYR